jgi:hypothetical protein
VLPPAERAKLAERMRRLPGEKAWRLGAFTDAGT